ncbi:MAG: alanine racemase [Deltaproteobacteria bacterium]|nr:alanine racemase [Deltaproteobacteria bacterium]
MNSSAVQSLAFTANSNSETVTSAQKSSHQNVANFPDPSRPAWIDVDFAALTNNLSEIRKRVAPAKVMAVVKANAYGHGLVPLGRFYEQSAVDMLGVALLEEALLLRENGIVCPILVFGGLLESQVPHFLLHQIDITVSSLSKLEQVERWSLHLGCKARIHIKLDTGMGRIGTRASSALPMIEAALMSKNCHLIGIFSHFACADDPHDKMTALQLERFEEGIGHFEKLGAPMPMRHLANSGAILHHPKSFFDMVRPGILLYGIRPDNKSRIALKLKRSLTLKAKTVFQKGLLKGQSVSYGATWKASKNTWISTLPIGYGDGFMRGLSGKAEVLYEGKRFPVVGKICMDQMMIESPEMCLPNDAEMTLIGRSGEEVITVENLAEQAQTIPYEILTNLNSRLPRYYS